MTNEEALDRARTLTHDMQELKQYIEDNKEFGFELSVSEFIRLIRPYVSGQAFGNRIDARKIRDLRQKRANKAEQAGDAHNVKPIDLNRRGRQYLHVLGRTKIERKVSQSRKFPAWKQIRPDENVDYELIWITDDRYREYCVTHEEIQYYIQAPTHSGGTCRSITLSKDGHNKINDWDDKYLVKDCKIDDLPDNFESWQK